MARTSSPPELFLPLRRHAALPLRAQLERELRHAVQSGRLRPGVPLPSTRALARDLGVSRGLVVQAYEQLLAEGYLTAAQGAATLVAPRRPPARAGAGWPPAVGTVSPGSPASAEVAAIPDARPQPGGRGRAGIASAGIPSAPPPTALRYDFRPGVPDLSLFPRREWLIALRRALAAAPAGALGYADARGAETAREAVAAYLDRARGTVARAEHVVLCTGFTQGLRLVCRVLRARGATRVVVEDPSHAEQRAIVTDAGLRAIPVAVDGDGLRVDRLPAIDADAALVAPAHQFPTGAVLSPARRAALLDWAARRPAMIIEDDYDAEYRYDRQPIGSLQGLAPERVVYAGSASKTLAPALRLGWMVVPGALVAEVARAKRGDDLGSPTLDQLAYAELLERGAVDRHLRRTRQHYQRRRDALAAALRARLPRLRRHGVAAGLHLMLELEAGADEVAIIAAAARRSVGVYGVGVHRRRPGAGPPALVLGYGAVPEDDIAPGVELLAEALREAARRG
jgi:GntR family transcriptional regulator/MocR family aminotransferase